MEERIRLVSLGAAKTGKTAILKRFLFNTFQEKYKATIEDIYIKEYDLGNVTLKADILDTSGEGQFPAMRRLSIATAHAFLLTYAVDNRESFVMLQKLLEEIREQRADFEDIPIVVAGNKIDVGLLRREVSQEEVCDFIEELFPSLRAKVVDCSAKEDINIRDVFRTFLTLSKLSPESEDAALKRRSSAHAAHVPMSPRSPTVPRSPCASSTSRSFFGSSSSPPQSSTPPTGTPTKNPSSPSYQQYLSEESALPKNKTRSRSLMRRSSKKVKQQFRDASGGPGDCQLA